MKCHVCGSDTDGLTTVVVTTREAAGIPAHVRPAYAPLVRLDGDLRPQSPVCAASTECGRKTAGVLELAGEAARKLRAGIRPTA